VIQQYEAVGHAVRAVYLYAGMTAVAMETGDVDYHSALKSLWSSIVNRKYYVTGGVGSGETSEGFGKDYSLPNNAYCESCAGCGEVFFQHAMSRAHGEANHADLYEETLHPTQPGRYHVVGVGGPGMSAIAIVLAQMGHVTSGSDLRDLPVYEIAGDTYRRDRA
jgi:hypothetical protein